MTDAYAPPATRGGRLALGAGLLATLAGYAAAIYYGIGPVPETFDLAWYHPRSTLIYKLQESSLAPLANRPRLGLLCLQLPALLLAAGAALALRSALARTAALALYLGTVVFLFLGLSSPGLWRLAQWRVSAVMLPFVLTVAAGVTAPLLAASWLRLRSGSFKLALYLLVFLISLAFMRNATGTDLSSAGVGGATFWPAIPFFGMAVACAFMAALYTGLALALGGWLARGRDPVLGYSAAAIGVVLVAWRLSTTPQTGFEVPLALFLLSIWALYLTGTLAPEVRARRAGRAAHAMGVGACLVTLPLFVGQALVVLDVAATRDGVAQRVIDGLAAYYETEEMYPESLDELVERGLLDSVPEPSIGFRAVTDDRFSYDGFGGNYLLAFSAAGWMQCQYSPPYLDEYEDDYDEYEEYEEYAEEGDLGGVWQCPSKPPDMW